MAKADKTKVDIKLPPPQAPKESISQYKPSFVDRIFDFLGDGPMQNIARGLYQGLDMGLLGLLPNRNYLSATPEENLATIASTAYVPGSGFKTARGASKALVSGVKIGDKSYPTPIGKLIVNTVEPEGYSSKAGGIMRALKNPKVLYDAVVRDMPQYTVRTGLDDRIFAWRKKFGIDYPPNKDYERVLNYNSKVYQKLASKVPHSGYVARQLEKSTPRTLKGIYAKFGKHVEDGQEYYHYKNPRDYFGQLGSDISHQFYGGPIKHNLFGAHKRTDRFKKGTQYTDYYDDWDFGLNRGLTNTLFDLYNKNIDWNVKDDFHYLVKSAKYNLPIVLQRMLGNALTRDLKFKGTAKLKDAESVL
tara:strand:+ start:1178 stop:2257 length:1080 start_codon:yes stop_codon:yes gene_type:complete